MPGEPLHLPKPLSAQDWSWYKKSIFFALCKSLAKALSFFLFRLPAIPEPADEKD